MAEQIGELKEIINATPVDKVISQIKILINSGVLKPGDRLPAERKMATDFGCGRTHIREALHKLEFYGIIKTLPQSGSIINGLDINTLDGLISDVLNLQDYDFFSLVETRFLLEVNSARLAAERRTESDIEAIQKAHDNYVKYFDTSAMVSYDFAFHRSIAEACHNPVIKAMLLVVIPDIMTVYENEKICDTNTIIIDEHARLLEAIKNRDGDLAASNMVQHLHAVMEFAGERVNRIRG
ncbi:MAG: FadR family transcriptional regulator [Bacteroidales bacterium]|nr:FadR family transcriptional regulator [Bacteroidales bacterium]MCB9012446.1 FadR family transcriptional regulator [Bacteroidales bacterium]